MDPEKILLAAVAASEQSRPRNQYTGIGPSGVGDCRRKVWLRLAGVRGDNPTKVFAAWMGTAIHESIAKGLYLLDPFGDKYLIEHSMKRDPFAGSVDLFDKSTGAVCDWKTSKKSNLGFLARGTELGSKAHLWPSLAQRWQVSLYGWMLEGEGHNVSTISLVGIARDGNEDTLRVHTEDYDPALAQEAIAWLKEVGDLPQAPAPEKNAYFCQSYCSYWSPDGDPCSGIPDNRG